MTKLTSIQHIIVISVRILARMSKAKGRPDALLAKTKYDCTSSQLMPLSYTVVEIGMAILLLFLPS